MHSEVGVAALPFCLRIILFNQMSPKVFVAADPNRGNTDTAQRFNRAGDLGVRKLAVAVDAARRP